MSNETIVDVLVVGAGPAGLTAATYLSRFLRRVLVADGGEPRAHWIPVSRNMPGFPEGVTGANILARMREQALEFGGVIETGRINLIQREGDGFRAWLNDREVVASTVLLATGVTDRVPAIPGVEDAVRRGLVRICPICDGYEATGRRIAVIGDDDAGAREAAFVRTYSDQVTLIHLGAPAALTQRQALVRLGVGLIEADVDGLSLSADAMHSVTWGDRSAAFDLVYSALGTSPSTELALALGAEVSEDGRLIVDDHGRTSIPGLHAAGDVVRGLNQIAVATAEAAIGATAIHNHLRRREGRTV